MIQQRRIVKEMTRCVTSNLSQVEADALTGPLQDLLTTLDCFNTPRSVQGTQYASVIFCDDEEQTKIATKVKGELQQLVQQGKIKQYARDTVETEIVATTPFIEAHEERK